LKQFVPVKIKVPIWFWGDGFLWVFIVQNKPAWSQ
jgi:hypothetical protein